MAHMKLNEIVYIMMKTMFW